MKATVDQTDLEMAIFTAGLRRAETDSDGAAAPFGLAHWASIVGGAVAARLPSEPVPERPRFDVVLARKSRGGPAKSLKASNITREISRTLYMTILLGLTPATLPAASPIGAFAIMVAVAYAGFNAVAASISYSEACVLHKCWVIALARQGKSLAIAELMDARAEIVSTYDAPKCASESEILDALRSLVGLRSITLEGDRILLKERILFLNEDAQPISLALDSHGEQESALPRSDDVQRLPERDDNHG